MTLDPGQGALHVFQQLCEQAPEQPFLRVNGIRLNRREFLHQVSVWAGAFSRQGVGVGDHVALITPNSMQWCVAFWALVSVGARPVPLDPQIGGWELENLLAVIDVKLCLAVTSYRSSPIAESLSRIRTQLPHPPVLVSLEGSAHGMLSCEEFLLGACPARVPSRAVEPEEPLMLACTSGTTGNPKIISVPHAGFVRSQIDMGRVLGASSGDRMLLGMPLYHQGGFGMGLQVLVSGGESIYEVGFDPQRFLETMESERVTVVQLSATLAKLLLSHPQFDSFDLSALRVCYFAGEVLPDRLAAEFWEKRRKRVINVIGSSETATMVLWDSLRDSHRSASEYQPLPFTAVHVGEAGPSSTSCDATRRDDPDREANATTLEPRSLSWTSENAAQSFTGVHVGEAGPNSTGRDATHCDDPDREANATAIEPGSLWVSTDALLLEYFANPKETQRRLVVKGGRRWFDTEDLVLPLPDGYVRFVGRRKRVIKRGPNLVHPEEVEAFLLTCPSVAAVAILREEHELFGESMVAWIQPAPHQALDRGKLSAFCRGKIAAYKVPDRFVIVEELSVDIGKIRYQRVGMDEKKNV
ncbi:MAG TPA: class I adenylate-forming enzyme family protein [Polyangiaceae bacterium]|nr:class I adenylate-forming enzyme family protein [Polyangiaceae bacterium]